MTAGGYDVALEHRTVDPRTLLATGLVMAAGAPE
jgi:hypothetical protein